MSRMTSKNDKRRRALRIISQSSSLLLAGVDRLVAIVEGGDTRHTFFRGGIHRIEKDLKSELFVLFYHF